MISEDEIKPVEDYLNIFKFIGGNLAETENGYRFNLKVKGNAEQLAKSGMSFNPGGNFTPSLYKNSRTQSRYFTKNLFNGKAGFEQTKKTLDKILAQGDQAAKTADEALDELFKDNIGIDIEELFGTMTRETAFAVQYDQNSPIPYFTLLSNVSDNRAMAEKFVADAIVLLKKKRAMKILILKMSQK